MKDRQAQYQRDDGGVGMGTEHPHRFRPPDLHLSNDLLGRTHEKTTRMSRPSLYNTFAAMAANGQKNRANLWTPGGSLAKLPIPRHPPHSGIGQDNR